MPDLSEPKKILLVPTDFSDRAERALDLAISLATRLGTEIELLHIQSESMTVLPPPLDVASFAPFNAQETLHIGDELDRRVARVRAAQVTCRSLNLVGNVADQIVARAQEIDAELVVMGTHGRTGLRHAVLGSVAERVVNRSAVPVLVVPTRTG